MSNEIIRRNNSGFFLTKGKSEVMLEYVTNHIPDLTEYSIVEINLQGNYDKNRATVVSNSRSIIDIV
jgi:hypothetical protein